MKLPYDNEIDKGLDYNTFLSMISNIPSNIFYKDKDLRYRFVSHYWAQVNNANIIGKTDLEVRKDQENVEAAMESDREILRTGKGSRYTIKSDIDGKVSYLELIKEPIKDENGEVIGIVGLINDVTDKSILEEKLRTLSQELQNRVTELAASNDELKGTLEKIEQMNKMEKLFTASMNHELRSPLNGIIGMMQIMKEDRSLSDIQYEYIQNAYQSSTMMLQIVNDLLDHAKMETSEFAIKNEEFNMHELVVSIRQFGETLAYEKKLRFITDSDFGNNEIFIGDQVRIKQILNNLVSNAIKYTSEGEVFLKLSYSDNKLKIICKDSGQGISKDAMGSLFEPYVRLNENLNKHIQGTGLGLSIVKKIIDKMNGSINVDSVVGEGSTFEVIIPLGLMNNEDVIDATTTQNSLAKCENKYIQILCVDDTKINVSVFEGMLKGTNANVDKAYSGKMAIEMINWKKYDVIFMDHMMPEMDGIQTFQTILSSDSFNRSTPVVIVTGNTGVEYEKEYKKLGFAGYLAKPVIKDKLLYILKNIGLTY